MKTFLINAYMIFTTCIASGLVLIVTGLFRGLGEILLGLFLLAVSPFMSIMNTRNEEFMDRVKNFWE